MTAATSAATTGPPRFSFRDTLIIARFELGESLRTRLLLVMVLLFIVGGGFSAWGFSKVVAELERISASAMGAPESKRTGASLDRLRKTPIYRTALRVAGGDEQKTNYLATQPPMALFFGWVTLMFTPWLVLLTASDTIASDVASRSIRYTALRTGRLEYALGKFIGQAAIIAGVIGLSGFTFYLVSWIFMDGFVHSEMLLGILGFWPRVVVYTLPFIGFALLASMVMSSANSARAFAILVSAVLGILLGFSKWQRLRTGPISNALWDLVTYVTPMDHKDGLFYPGGATFWTDVAMCLALTAVYFSIGFAVLRRRDL